MKGKRLNKIIVFFIISVILANKGYAQLTDGITGLLHMPNAEVQKDGTFMIGGNYLNYRNVPFINYGWYKYNTYNYFLNITLFKRLEISYICTLNKGIPHSSYWPSQTWGKFRNQDRHFAAKLQLIKENQISEYMPSIAIGVSDPTTGEGSHDYSDFGVTGSGNGYFNVWYIAASKHFNTKYAEYGIHIAYLYNKRTDNPLNGPAIGFNFRPNLHKNLNLIVEYDAKTINMGATYSLWADHFNFLFELQKGKYISAGLVYKVNLKGGNKWKSNIWE